QHFFRHTGERMRRQRKADDQDSPGFLHELLRPAPKQQQKGLDIIYCRRTFKTGQRTLLRGKVCRLGQRAALVRFYGLRLQRRWAEPALGRPRSCLETSSWQPASAGSATLLCTWRATAGTS